MEAISQREMRNRSGEILRAVAAGDSFTITNDGVPVARLTPIDATESLRIARPAKKRGGFSTLPRVKIDRPTMEDLDDLRGDR